MDINVNQEIGTICKTKNVNHKSNQFVLVIKKLTDASYLVMDLTRINLISKGNIDFNKKTSLSLDEFVDFFYVIPESQKMMKD